MQSHNSKSTITTTILNNNHKTLTRSGNHGSTTQACAACKYHRRKCASNCILSPYLPHDRQLQFMNAHRLFGVSNIVKIVGNLKQPEKDCTMQTIAFQSDVKGADPIGGCYHIIRNLERQISLAKAELEIVLHNLTLCRAAAAAQQQVMAVPPQEGGDFLDDERWRGQYVVEDEATAEYLNSRGSIAAGDVNEHAVSVIFISSS